jgi:lysozyme family protein
MDEIKGIFTRISEGEEVSLIELKQAFHGIERAILSQKNLGFDTCFDRLISHEGGYVNDPSDPGGETKWGISKRSYPTLDIPNLSREEAKAIYKRDFWNTINANRLPGSVCYQLFDFAVNSGIATTIRGLQNVVGVAADGHWGPMSQAAADAMSEADLLLGINAYRLDFMTRLKNWDNASRGWARRIAGNLKFATEDNVF